jgi:hypothetical protein
MDTSRSKFLENSCKLSKDHNFSIKKVRSISRYTSLKYSRTIALKHVFDVNLQRNWPVSERNVGGQGGAGQAGPEDQGEAGEGAGQRQPRGHRSQATSFFATSMTLHYFKLA